MSILERVRASGKCPPTLVGGNPDTDFETAALKVVDANELYLSFETTVPVDFKALLELTTSNTGNNDVLISRRAAILTLVASTPLENTMLDIVLKDGYLRKVKVWLDDILKGTLGGIDLLLHLFTKIAQLPVTKSVVKESGLGKAIGSIEKHRICVDSPNKPAIVERVNAIKSAWNKSVKLRKETPQSSTSASDKPSSSKRELEVASQSATKKLKVDDTKKSSSVFSSLMKKVDAGAGAGATNTASRLSSTNGDISKKAAAKKPGKRLKWKDHFGGKLEAAKVINSENMTLSDEIEEAAGSMADRKNRDRLRERELIAKAKKKKLLDDDDDLGSESRMPVTVQPTIAWHVPPLLPERPDAPPPQNNSKEKISQTTRMATVVQAVYPSELHVPMNPAPLSDVEQALDMTSQSSVVTQVIPFFVPQAPAAPAPAPQPVSTSPPPYPPPLPQTNSGAASAETVQALGLPPFLVGQDLQALQTLAGTPKLLGSFVDSNGMYNQVGLMNLVQTLSQNSPTSGQQSQGSNTGYQQTSMGQNVGAYGQSQGSGGMYGAPSDMNQYGGGQSSYGSTNSWQGNGMKATGYRGAQNNSDGNLHLSGYGPGTTQSEIIALFSPYVQVSEVVMKATFSFVNTNDPEGAKQAREALNGALLGGAPVRINTAQRKNRDQNQGMGGPTAGSHYGRNNAGFGGGFGQSQVPPPPPMGQPPGQAGGDPSQVRDDRGNPATKNLFVAGYGQGTSEHQLREIFSQHAQITGIISKGTFSFVNTTEKAAAIRARELLAGTMVNGGVLRINFAKETGRLGTSFDLTYSGGGGGGGGGQNRSHYGRY